MNPTISQTTMQALLCPRYGSTDQLTYTQVPVPSPKANEVLIKVKAVALNAADWRLMRGEPYFFRLFMGLTQPKFPILGSDVAGQVVAVGAAVTEFVVGDEVMGDLSNDGLGGLAEYVCAPANQLIVKPNTLSFEEAAAIPMAALTAYEGLRTVGQVQAGEKVLVHGASGGVGTYAVQLAKVLGAEVTALCSTAKMEQARALGADQVIDYTQEDFRERGPYFDLILGVNGDNSLKDYQKALVAKGRYVVLGGSLKQIFQTMLLGGLFSLFSSQSFKVCSTKPDTEKLQLLLQLVTAGKMRPCLDQTYSLQDAASAIRYVEAGHAKGKVIVIP